MKQHTTNYQDTFIEVAPDCPVKTAEVPPLKLSGKTAANLQFEMIMENPYTFTSDDVLFHCFAVKNQIPRSQLKAAREAYFSKGQPCLRASPLTKRYGWGVHCDAAGKVAIFGVETSNYKKLAADKTLKIVKAMRSGR
ncbi:DUF6157 family protein [Niabella beijingensis]|uniref:DUF6157 family protein n=1 Tax=Niabella beijingensis TaxID=2872700 RepID=UPI001CBB6D2B|nr:DUF6157 family protein [Niabella beijingensis]MBZ4190521.1 DUF6157 family protein [Niabella beijingensis]